VTSATTEGRITKPTACTKLPYDLFLPLSNYAPAESYCSSKYPVVIETVLVCGKTVEVSTTTSISTLVPKRSPKTTATPTSTCNAQCQLFSTLVASAQGFVSTVCACIESQGTTTITVSKDVIFFASWLGSIMANFLCKELCCEFNCLGGYRIWSSDLLHNIKHSARSTDFGLGLFSWFLGDSMVSSRFVYASSSNFSFFS
jgi:hypothetical protein